LVKINKIIKENMRKFVLAAALVTGVVLTFSGCTTVDAGHVGVPTYFGKVGDHSFSEGIHGINPLTTTVYHLDARIQKLTVKASATSSDLQTVKSTVALNYRVDSSRVLELYRDIGIEYETTIIRPCLQESIKTVTARYTAEELVSSRQKVKDEILSIVTATLNESNLLVTDLSVENFEYSEAYADAIERKQVAEQAAQEAKNDLDRIRVEAEQVEAEAMGFAAATLAREKASSEAMLIRAEAEAKALEVQGKYLTQDLIRLRSIEKWDGKLPTYQGADGSFINLK
jgi:regulator of protease activity HflC (stomatin/prohibitin superfamily)